jgi:hypothetical protein
MSLPGTTSIPRGIDVFLVTSELNASRNVKRLAPFATENRRRDLGARHQLKMSQASAGPSITVGSRYG